MLKYCCSYIKTSFLASQVFRNLEELPHIMIGNFFFNHSMSVVLWVIQCITITM